MVFCSTFVVLFVFLPSKTHIYATKKKKQRVFSYYSCLLSCAMLTILSYEVFFVLIFFCCLVNVIENHAVENCPHLKYVNWRKKIPFDHLFVIRKLIQAERIICIWREKNPIDNKLNDIQSWNKKIYICSDFSTNKQMFVLIRYRWFEEKRR